MLYATVHTTKMSGSKQLGVSPTFCNSSSIVKYITVTGSRDVVRKIIYVQPFIVYSKETCNFPDICPCLKVLYERLEKVFATIDEFYCTDTMHTDDQERTNFNIHTRHLLAIVFMEIPAQTGGITSLSRPAFVDPVAISARNILHSTTCLSRILYHLIYDPCSRTWDSDDVNF